jgi:hypothetical protein
MKFNYHDYYRPCHDVVFSIMFADKALFVRLCSSVYGQPVAIVGEPHSQAVMRENDVLLNSIRFDILAIADENQIFTLDMQRRYTQGRQERRGVYYMCRSVSTQKVIKMEYEKLHPVHIAFILTEYPNAQSGIRKVGLCYLDTGELYDDLIELVLVYVPEVIKDPQKNGVSKNDDLYVFTRFFAVSSPKKAAAYAAEFKTNNLARELIRVYNLTVANPQNLQAIENEPYFTQRLTEAQLAEVRAEAEAQGEAKVRRLNEAQLAEARAEAEAKGASQLLKLIKEGYDADTAFKMITEKNS